MSSLQARRIRKGMLITFEKGLWRVEDIHHLTPGNLRSFMQVRMRDIRTGRVTDYKFRSEDMVDRAILDEREMQFLYREGDQYVFMDTSTYEQLHLSSDVLGDQALYLLPESLIKVEQYEDKPVGIELPQTVDLKVTDCSPGIKGATASAQVKPATLETGLVVTVPSFINPGDLIRVNTETGEYLSRV
jgi:elongation factor P